MENYELKCGEAYLTLKGNIVFHCTLCESQYNGFPEYDAHVSAEHYKPTCKEESSFDAKGFCSNETPSLLLQKNDVSQLKKKTSSDAANVLDEKELDVVEIRKHELSVEPLKDYDSMVHMPKEYYAACKEEDNVFADCHNDIPSLDVKNDNEMDKKNSQRSMFIDDSKIASTIELSELFKDEFHKTVSPMDVTELRDKIDGDSNQASNKQQKKRPSRSKSASCFKKDKYKCSECDYSTNVKRAVVDHTRRHFDDRPHECPHCPSRFYRPSDVQRHARRHIDINSSKNVLLHRPKDIPRLIKTDDGQLKCTACDFTSKANSVMLHHVKRHSSHKPYQCQDCSKSFYTRSELHIHIRSHTGEKPFLCPECGRAFTTSSHLSEHVKKHSNIRDKPCPSCNMKFFNTTQLRNHMTVHSDARPHVCQVCNDRFKRPKALKTHMKIHENKREYKCHVCPAGFNQPAGLVSHMKSKHPVADSINS